MDSTLRFIATRQWQRDADARECGACRITFTLLRRRHHCRACGRVFCDDCTQSRCLFVNTELFAKPQRVCQACIILAARAHVAAPRAAPAPVAAPAAVVVPQMSPGIGNGHMLGVAAAVAVAQPGGAAQSKGLPASTPVVPPSSAPVARAKYVHINISPETPLGETILCTNGWSLCNKEPAKVPDGKAVWVLASPDPSHALAREEEQEQEHEEGQLRRKLDFRTKRLERLKTKRRRTKRELLRLFPFVDILTVTGVELCVELRAGRGMICGEIRLLTGSCWNPSDIKELWFNGDWHVSDAAEVPVVGSFGEAGYVRWSAMKPGVRDASKTFIRGNSRWPHARLGPSFRFKTFDTDSKCSFLRNTSLIQQCRPPTFVLSAVESRAHIQLSNGYFLKRDPKAVSLPLWNLSKDGRSKGPFIDTLVLRNVLLCCGTGNMWWEGHVAVLAGAALYFVGGNFMFNGSWTISQDACVPARAGGRIVALQAVAPNFLQNVQKSGETSCRRTELFVKFCTNGKRAGAGTHYFGPAFDCKLDFSQ